MPSLARPGQPARSTTATLPYPQEAIPVSIEQLFGLLFFSGLRAGSEQTIVVTGEI
jgi:hypothetical protein